MSNLFIKVDNITGESQDVDHLGWIDIRSYSWGVNRTHAGKGGAHHLNLITQATMDKSTPTLFLYASNGNKVPKIILSACKAGGTQMEYCRVTLENTLIAAVVLNDNGSMGSIQYEFQADSVKLQYWEQSAAGGRGAETRMGWNIKDSTSYF